MHILSVPVLALLAAMFLLTPLRGRAQAEVEFEDVRAVVEFGERITFLATVRLHSTVEAISIVLADEAHGFTQVHPLALNVDGTTAFQFDARQHGLRPFSRVNWHYRFTFPDGSVGQSETFHVRYADDRFPWRMLESGMVRLSWYQGNAHFGQAAMEAALASLGEIGSSMPFDTSQPLEIFIYANTDDLRGTLTPGNESWVAGHADPALGVAMVAVEPGPGQSVDMAQRIPHELMHLLLYRHIGPGYSHVPAWLREGMAALAEAAPAPEYDRRLAGAVSSSSLIPLQELCTAFPAETDRAVLAYAEARSFTGYLRERYGSAGLLNLAASYAGGAGCEEGPVRTFGGSLSELESQWRATLEGGPAFLPALQRSAPYLAILCLILTLPLAGMFRMLRKGSRRERGIYNGN